MRRKNLALGFAAFATIATASQAAPVDLSTWVVNGSGNWVLQGGDDSVLQTLNSAPTIFHNNTNSQFTSLAGTIQVTTSSDDDFFGFVLGYQDGELFDAGATYYLLDWKQGTQSGWSAGMTFSRVDGDAGTGVCGTCTNADLWDHNGVVTPIASALTLGSTGWADNTEYSFEILYTPTLIEISIDSVLQFSLPGVWEDGAFGFYNFSQPNVLYAGITTEVIPDPDPDPDPPTDVPAPGALGLLGLGLAGVALRRRRR